MVKNEERLQDIIYTLEALREEVDALSPVNDEDWMERARALKVLLDCSTLQAIRLAEMGADE